MKHAFAFLATVLFLPTFSVSAMAQGRSGAVGVIVAPVEQTEWVETVEALGTLKAREQVVITSTVADKVSKINFDDGQIVAKGAVLIELESAEERAELQAAKSDFSESEKQYNRAKELRAKGATAQSVLDEQRRVYEIAKAQVGVAESQLQDLIIRAPFSGTLGIIQISPGAYITGGEVITTLTDTSSMRLDFNVPELYMSGIKVGQQVEVTTPVYPNQTFEGAITAIDNRVDLVSRSFSVRATLPNAEGLLKSGMLMTVQVQKAPEQTLVLPESALIPQSAANYAFVIDQTTENPTVSKKEVEVGRRKAGKVEVLGGLESGELVVTHGALKLADGRPVKILANQADGRSIPDILSSLYTKTDQK